ncbi:MAG: hypothetical protein OEM22_00185 [Acidimicrobiia bacterium]|nr:hypothetical protein [Acidimicrobiia bacterium]MDH3469878.1 hypothetical protein [Acidimicrobiia bacterium]
MIKSERGTTTVEWLGMAAVVVLVIAFLLPEIRNTAGSLWSSISNQVAGFF